MICLTQSMSLNHKMIDKIEELRSENAILYRQIEECRDTLRTLISKDFESLNDNKRLFFILLESKKRYNKICACYGKVKELRGECFAGGL